MPRTLLYLIKASGYSGTSGQSFRYHVAGSPTTGTKMSDYNCTAWTRDQDAPGNNGETLLSSPQSFVLTYQLTKGSKFSSIQRTDSGSVGAFMSSSGVGVPGASCSLSSIGITSTQVGYTLNVASKPTPGAQPASNISSWQNPTVYGATKWFADYSYPTLAPVGTAESIAFALDTTSSPGSPGSQVYDVDVHYTPDIGPYNSTLTETYHLLMTDRVTTLGDFDIEWSNDGSTVASTGAFHTRLQSVAYENFTVYYRYRYAGSGGSFSSWQAVQWQDPRI